MGLYLALGIMIPIRLGTVAILQLMVASGLVNTLTSLILVYTAQGLPLAVFILNEFMRAGERRSEERRAHRRAQSEYTIFFQPGSAAWCGLSHGDGGGVQHDPDLERPVVPADPGAGGRNQDADARQLRCSSASSSTDWNAVLAALSMAILPVLILYVIFSRQLIRGITSGAVK